jgi:hypothetical protein
MWKHRPNHGFTKNMHQGNENEMLGVTLHTYLPIKKYID